MENDLKFKYILYITINTKNLKFYIGVHKTTSPNKFDGYLGCGAWIDKPCSYNKGKVPLHCAILKYGTHSFVRRTLVVFDNEKDALELESKIVNKEFIRMPNNYNATVGGGIPPFSGKTINQFSLNGEFIKTWESEAAINRHFNMQARIREYIDKRKNFQGYFWTDGNIKHINVEDYIKISLRGMIEQYNSEGKYLTSFKSVNEASQKLDIDYKKIISATFHKRLCDGYYFIKSGDSLNDILNPSPKRTPNKIPICRYLVTGQFDRLFNTCSEAVRNTPCVTVSSLKKAVIAGYKCGGFLWSYKKKNNYFDIENPNEYPKYPAILQYDKNGNLIKRWENYKDCKHHFKYCMDVCNGKCHSTEGYIFKYEIKDIV